MTRLPVITLIPASLCAALGLAACAGPQGTLLLLEGNFFKAQGAWEKAAAAYTRARAYPGAAAYGEYGLGVIYLSLGEQDAALGRFAAAEQTLQEDALQKSQQSQKSQSEQKDRELRYRLHYNRGVAWFRGGAYAEAAGAFKAALETDGERLEAKRNLELSLLSLAQSRAAAGAAAPRETPPPKNPAPQALFDFVRRKEEDQWKNRQWQQEQNETGPDY